MCDLCIFFFQAEDGIRDIGVTGVQTCALPISAGGDVSRLVGGFPDMLVEKCDGTDPVESLETLRRAVEHCRQRRGPALVHAKVIRPYSHSLSDDEKLYRPEIGRASCRERV